ncbi:DNA-binding response regulator, partial [Vibrio sp. 10N.222.49.C9]
MNTRTLLILAEKNLQTSLLEKQLSTNPNLHVHTCLPEEAITNSQTLVTDLVLIEHSYLRAID